MYLKKLIGVTIDFFFQKKKLKSVFPSQESNFSSDLGEADLKELG
jgi:hypothetical protein